MRIYVTDHSGIYGGIYFWAIDAEEKTKTYKVLKAWEYSGNGLGKEARSLMLLKQYNKNDVRVSLDFEEARQKAIKVAEKMIADQEEKLNRNKEKLDMWKK